MAVVLSAGDPLEASRHPIGRSTTVLVDSERDDRMLGVDCWYPSLGDEGDPSVYELLPGLGFTASALADTPVAPGPFPLVLFSHGRSGTRSSYAMLCEGLASRGYVVVALDHPGDMLADWLLGSAVDDRTNEAQRASDVRFVLDVVLGQSNPLAVRPTIDATRVALAGHSYGGNTMFRMAGADQKDHRIKAVAGLQSFTRTLSPNVLSRVSVPSLLIAGVRDATCPPDTDATPAFAALANAEARRFDLDQAGHQACSDVGLYLELVPDAGPLPELLTLFLESLAGQVTGTPGDPWRPTVGVHLDLLGTWLDVVLNGNAAAANSLDELGRTPGISMQHKPGRQPPFR